jgi:hypothetical protein
MPTLPCARAAAKRKRAEAVSRTSVLAPAHLPAAARRPGVPRNLRQASPCLRLGQRRVSSPSPIQPPARLRSSVPGLRRHLRASPPSPRLRSGPLRARQPQSMEIPRLPPPRHQPLAPRRPAQPRPRPAISARNISIVSSAGRNFGVMRRASPWTLRVCAGDRSGCQRKGRPGEPARNGGGRRRPSAERSPAAPHRLSPPRAPSASSTASPAPRPWWWARTEI